MFFFLFFQAEDGIRDLVRSRGLGDVYKRQVPDFIGMMAEQSALAVKSMDALVAYMEYPTPEALSLIHI